MVIDNDDIDINYDNKEKHIMNIGKEDNINKKNI